MSSTGQGGAGKHPVQRRAQDARTHARTHGKPPRASASPAQPARAKHRPCCAEAGLASSPRVSPAARRPGWPLDRASPCADRASGGPAGGQDAHHRHEQQAQPVLQADSAAGQVPDSTGERVSVASRGHHPAVPRLWTLLASPGRGHSRCSARPSARAPPQPASVAGPLPVAPFPPCPSSPGAPAQRPLPTAESHPGEGQEGPTAGPAPGLEDAGNRAEGGDRARGGGHGPRGQPADPLSPVRGLGLNQELSLSLGSSEDRGNGSARRAKPEVSGHRGGAVEAVEDGRYSTARWGLLQPGHQSVVRAVSRPWSVKAAPPQSFSFLF